MNEWMETAALILLWGASRQDIRSRTIRRWWIFLHLAGAAVCCGIGQRAVWPGLAGMLLGGVLLAVSLLSAESIGKGDAGVVAALGGYLGFWDTAAVLLAAFALAAVWGAVWMLVRKVGPRRKMVFTPFLLAGFLLWLAGGCL